MKNKLTFSASIAAVAAALTWMVWPGHADPYRHAPQANSEAVSANDVLANIRASGLSPIGRIVRRGEYYVVHAIDPRGIEVRVVTDSVFGDILSVAAARPVVPAYAARYDSGPRIIHIPDRHASQERVINQSRANQSQALQPYDDAALTEDEDEAPAAALPKRRRAAPDDEVLAPLPKRRQAAPAPEVKPRRSVLNVPPPAIDGPTPIKPTPRWRAAEKFTAPPAVPPVQPQVEAVPAPAADAPAAAAPTANDSMASVPDAADTPPEGPTLDLRPPNAPPAPTQ